MQVHHQDVKMAAAVTKFEGPTVLHFLVDMNEVATGMSWKTVLGNDEKMGVPKSSSSFVQSVALTKFFIMLFFSELTLYKVLLFGTLNGKLLVNVTCLCRYPKWMHTFENQLSLDFRTKQNNALLLYVDDGGAQGNFYSLTVANGKLQLDFRFVGLLIIYMPLIFFTYFILYFQIYSLNLCLPIVYAVWLNTTLSGYIRIIRTLSVLPSISLKCNPLRLQLIRTIPTWTTCYEWMYGIVGPAAVCGVQLSRIKCGVCSLDRSYQNINSTCFGPGRYNCLCKCDGGWISRKKLNIC